MKDWYARDLALKDVVLIFLLTNPSVLLVFALMLLM